MSAAGLTKDELRDAVGLSGIFALRMLGLFLLLPVLSLYTSGLPGSTPMLAGLSVGIYALAQTIFQIPFAVASDRFDRRNVVAFGLLLFAAGSVVSALAQDAPTLVLGRFIQGAGAIPSVIMAMIADRTREEVRARAMAVVGMSIGLSFGIGMLFGPVLAFRVGVPVLFWGICAGAGAALAYLYWILPPAAPREGSAVPWSRMAGILANRDLAALNFLMFVLHLGMTAVFVVSPHLLLEHWPKNEHWRIYAPMILLGGGLMFPAVSFAEKRGAVKSLIALGIAVCAAGFLLFALSGGRAFAVAAAMTVYFIGFNFMEPSLPSLVTRLAPTELRGTATGVFTMSQFLGAFCGSALGGWFLGHGRIPLFWVLLGLCLPWSAALWALSTPPPRVSR